MKRLFFDIETSYAIVSTFQIGYNLSLTHKDILVEPKIICICWKWEGDETVYSDKWDEGDDKEMIRRFIKIMDSADEIVGHNSDGFDITWIRGRAVAHRLDMRHDYPSFDTLKAAKGRAGKGFKFLSNRLDYIAKFLKVGGKIQTDATLWQRISYPALLPKQYPITKDYHEALSMMVTYCKNDVVILEEVYKVLTPYVPAKRHAGLIHGGEIWDCPHCASGNTLKKGFEYSMKTRKQRMQCRDCKKKYSLTLRDAKMRDVYLLELKK